MLNKINYIKNVGRYYEVTPKGTPDSSPEFERFNLIYADNGTGKTTFGAIIKSLANNDPNQILSRATVPGDKDCEVSIKFDNRQCNFLKGSWRALPDSKIEIFDEDFIDKNIFSASNIDPSHKRELFNYVILGEENVAMAQELQSLVSDKIPKNKKEISALESQLKTDAKVNDMSLLLETKELPDVEFKILESETKSLDSQIKNSNLIKSHKSLEELKMPDWPNFISTLSKGLNEISNIDAFKEHISMHQSWIKQGLELIPPSNNCPFCFQDLTDNEAIQAYKLFFSQQTQSLINDTNALETNVSNQLSSDKAALVVKTAETNKDLLTFWNSVDSNIASPPEFTEKYIERINHYREAALQLIELKQKNILQPINIGADTQKFLDTETEIKTEINTYNNAIKEANTKIDTIKTMHLNIEGLKEIYEQKHLIVRCQKTAFRNIDTKLKLEKYKSLLEKKQELTKRINTLRSEIATSSTELLDTYQSTINGLLKNFGVEFRLANVERKIDTASKDTLTFMIELKGLIFDPNGAKNTPYKLANTLSSGDKSTLAFALFIAKIQHSNLDETVIVFDDPISSLDFFRKQQTSKQICQISSEAKQVIVLTHSMGFAKLFGNNVRVNKKYFKLFKSDSLSGLIVKPYNKLSDMDIPKHYIEHETITMYLSSPTSVERIDVMKSIRSYAETKLCTYIPELSTLNPPNLGTFINHLRKKSTIESYLSDLEIINDSIVAEYHGGDVTITDHANLTDEELRNLCNLVLDLSAPPNA